MKFRYLVGFAALALLASCSKNENTQVPEDAWVYDESLPVPVTFATPEVAVESKAGLISGQITGSELPAGLDLGIYALATGEGAKPWSGDGNLINNRQVVTGEGGSIAFDPAVYYPMTSDQNFSFFGYYPYTANAVASANCEVTLPVDGVTDILWGKAYAATVLQDPELHGYNAAYVRRVKKAGAESQRLLPKMAFKHVLTALKFQAVLEDADLSTSEVQVYRLRLINETTSVLMRVAKSEADVATYEPELVGQASDNIWIRKEANVSSEAALNQTITADAVDLGVPVLVVPKASYTVEIDVVVDGKTTTMQLPVQRNGADLSFEAGYEYTLTVKVKSPVEVEIVETSLEPWKPVTGGDIEFGD